MDRRKGVLIGALLAGGGYLAALAADPLTYYRWTDDQGVVHMADTPPSGRDYETRVIDAGQNVISGPRPGSPDSASDTGPEDRTRRATASRRDAAPLSGDSEAALAEHAQRQETGTDSGGAETAAGADTATGGAAAPAAGAAAGGATAPGAAVAPGAVFLPPPAIPGP